jgi:hypothetical protein
MQWPLLAFSSGGFFAAGDTNIELLLDRTISELGLVYKTGSTSTLVVDTDGRPVVFSAKAVRAVAYSLYSAKVVVGLPNGQVEVIFTSSAYATSFMATLNSSTTTLTLCPIPM